MAGKMFRVGMHWINLAMVTWVEEIAPMSWAHPEDDEGAPRLFVTTLTGQVIQLAEREAIATGFTDMAACAAALIAALGAYNG